MGVRYSQGHLGHQLFLKGREARLLPRQRGRDQNSDGGDGWLEGPLSKEQGGGPDNGQTVLGAPKATCCLVFTCSPIRPQWNALEPHQSIHATDRAQPTALLPEVPPSVVTAPRWGKEEEQPLALWQR